MVRTPSFDKNGIKKGAWSPEEDEILKDCIVKFGISNWRQLPKLAGLKRCGKSCRLRWMNYLRPDLKHGNYTKEEEDLILQLYQQHQNKWAKIAAQLPGRTDNEIKNHWHTHLKKRAGLQKPTKNIKTHKPLHVENNNPTSPMKISGDHIQILESFPLSPSEMGSSLTSTTSGDISSSVFEISNPSDFDDGGLEEILNTCDDFFGDMSSLLSPLDQARTYDHEPYNAAMSYDLDFGIKENWTIAMDGMWSEPPSEDYNQVLLSPCANYYYDDSVFDLF